MAQLRSVTCMPYGITQCYLLPDTRRGRSRGGSFIPGMGKNFGERVRWYSHFLETHTGKQHHTCNIPHIGY